MTLFKKWEDLMNSQTEETFDAFWKEYSETETRIYTHILANYKENLKGTFKELVEKFDADPVIFMGFLDGINSSLVEENDLEKFKESTQIELKIDYDKLFFNMLGAGADYLYTLEEWEEVLTKERRLEIVKEYKRSKIVVKEKTPGRNDPCPCGSGKKYKKCCGANK